MQLLIIFSVLLVAAYGITPELLKTMKLHFKQYGSDCKAELGASDDDIAPLLSHLPATTDKGKCLIACMHKKYGFQDASGKISKDAALAALEKLKPLDEDYYNSAKKVADACLASVHDHDNECDTAAAMYECVLAEKDKAGLPLIDLHE